MHAKNTASDAEPDIADEKSGVSLSLLWWLSVFFGSGKIFLILFSEFRDDFHPSAPFSHLRIQRKDMLS